MIADMMKRMVTRCLWLVLAVSVAAVLYHMYDNRRAAASNAKAAMLAGLEHKDAPSVPAPLPEEALSLIHISEPTRPY